MPTHQGIIVDGLGRREHTAEQIAAMRCFQAGAMENDGGAVVLPYKKNLMAEATVAVPAPAAVARASTHAVSVSSGFA